METAGPEAAIETLNVDKKVELTQLAENSEQQIAVVEQAWRECGAVIHRLTPENHDAIFAAVSHLPHLLAYALVNDIAGKPHADLLFQYAASGFRDFTRIAGSSPEMWRDISLSNQAAIVTELDAYVAQLMRLRSKLVALDGDALLTLFSNARGARQNWLDNLDMADTSSKKDKNA
jgi:prephenate dehydrogenase